MSKKLAAQLVKALQSSVTNRAALYTTHATTKSTAPAAAASTFQAAIQAELHDLRNQIPLIVRSIWGRHNSETVIASLRQHRSVGAKRLLADWQEAEQRLIAVGNSLTTLHAGQKLVLVGVPLAAAHLLGTSKEAHCYSTPATAAALHGDGRRRTVSALELSLKQAFDKLQHELTLARRGIFLALLFLPLLATAPFCLLGGDAQRSKWLSLLRWTLERAGPAFIKWGQWAATRPDLFPQEFCTKLTELQTNAPQHDFTATRSIVEEAFGHPLEALFSEFDEKPVASGSIAQVHRARLSPEGAVLAGGKGEVVGGLLRLPERSRHRRQHATFVPGATVAVKVRHPHVTEIMERDFILIERAAAIIGTVYPSAAFRESLMQFGAPMREQLDLRSEADHLAKFADNFKWWSSVRFPLPAAKTMVASDVLVESFEEGKHISEYLGTSCRHNKKMAGLGVSLYLKMLLNDNYIHADLHPGNILVRLDAPTPGSLTARAAAALRREAPRFPRLVLLDVGMTAKLTPDDQINLVGFFKGLTSLDGAAVADSILRFAATDAGDEKAFSTTAAASIETAHLATETTTIASSQHSAITTIERTSRKQAAEQSRQEQNKATANNAAAARFREDMTTLFSQLDPEHMRQHTSDVMAEMMDTIRRHGVHIRGVVSTVVITSMVLEGWSSKLDPDVRILEAVKHLLPSAWGERVSSAVDKVLGSNALAVV